MGSRWIRAAFLGASALPIIGVGCSDHHRHHDDRVEVRHEIIVNEPPPPARREVVVASPGPDYVWIEGYYVRSGRQWAWTPGRWERRPRARAEWVPGRWDHRDKGYVWIDGRWR